jgi:hypothetical protein
MDSVRELHEPVHDVRVCEVYDVAVLVGVALRDRLSPTVTMPAPPFAKADVNATNSSVTRPSRVQRKGSAGETSIRFFTVSGPTLRGRKICSYLMSSSLQKAYFKTIIQKKRAASWKAPP